MTTAGVTGSILGLGSAAAFDTASIEPWDPDQPPVVMGCAAGPERDTIVFVRHKSGPIYYGYECLGTRYFAKPAPNVWQKNN